MQAPTATEVRAKIANGETTARAVVEDCLDRIETREADVQAFAHVDADGARAAADAIDAGRRSGPLGGAPFAAKDIIDTHDMPTGYGSPIHTGARPPADASCVALARAAGAVLLGKTVTTEFANLTPGPTRNPCDLERTPGGSSSGSAAAVAAGMVAMAYGTQTTQSTIRPAGFCGVHGYCPTQGDFRLSGVREAAGSFDRLGLIARSLADIALFRDVLLRRSAARFAPADTAPRIGLCRTRLWDDVDGHYRGEIEAAAKRLDQAGAAVVDIDLPPDVADLAEAHRVISSYEFARNFAFEIDRHWDRISERLRQGRIADGLATDYDSYRAALATAAAARAKLPTVFEGVDVLIAPSTLGEAPLGIDATGSAAIGAVFTPLYLPCLTLPVFAGGASMPLGLQVLAPEGADDRMLAWAAWIENRL